MKPLSELQQQGNPLQELHGRRDGIEGLRAHCPALTQDVLNLPSFSPEVKALIRRYEQMGYTVRQLSPQQAAMMEAQGVRAIRTGGTVNPADIDLRPMQKRLKDRSRNQGCGAECVIWICIGIGVPVCLGLWHYTWKSGVGGDDPDTD